MPGGTKGWAGAPKARTTAESVGKNAIKGTTRKAPHHFPSTIVRAESGVVKSTSRSVPVVALLLGPRRPGPHGDRENPDAGREARHDDQVGMT